MKTWPLIDPLGRLPQILKQYGRSELLLRVNRIHRCTFQNDQVTVDIEDTSGALLHDASGRGPWHTFQLAPQAPPVAPGQRFRIVQDRTGVHTELIWPEASAAD